MPHACRYTLGKAHACLWRDDICCRALPSALFCYAHGEKATIPVLRFLRFSADGWCASCATGGYDTAFGQVSHFTCHWRWHFAVHVFVLLTSGKTPDGFFLCCDVGLIVLTDEGVWRCLCYVCIHCLSVFSVLATFHAIILLAFFAAMMTVSSMHLPFSRASRCVCLMLYRAYSRAGRVISSFRAVRRPRHSFRYRRALTLPASSRYQHGKITGRIRIWYYGGKTPVPAILVLFSSLLPVLWCLYIPCLVYSSWFFFLSVTAIANMLCFCCISDCGSDGDDIQIWVTFHYVLLVHIKTHHNEVSVTLYILVYAYHDIALLYSLLLETPYSSVSFLLVQWFSYLARLKYLIHVPTLSSMKKVTMTVRSCLCYDSYHHISETFYYTTFCLSFCVVSHFIFLL